MTAIDPDPIASGFLALAEFLVDDGTLSDTLCRVAELVCQAAPADMASLTLLIDGRPATAVSTDATAAEIDQGQYVSGDGPCVDAFGHRQVNRIDSTTDEARWPEFCRGAAAQGITSTLSLPIVARGEALAALNLYSRRPAAFGDGDAARLDPFVRQAAVVLANARVFSDARELNENLNQALASRATIDYAIGLVMARGGRSPEEAFDVLVRASQRENRKLRDIAADMVGRASGTPPPGPARRAATGR